MSSASHSTVTPARRATPICSQSGPHLETCEVCIELDALSFAELAGYKADDAPSLFFLTGYYAMDGISPERVAHIRERVLALCTVGAGQ